MRLRILHQGSRAQVVTVVGALDDCPLLDDFNTLCGSSKQAAKAIAKLDNMWQTCADRGLDGIPSAWTHAADPAREIFSFLAGAFRVLYFTGEGKVVVVGFCHQKKGQKADSALVARAKILRKEYLNAVRSRTVKFAVPGEECG